MQSRTPPYFFGTSTTRFIQAVGPSAGSIMSCRNKVCRNLSSPFFDEMECVGDFDLQEPHCSQYVTSLHFSYALKRLWILVANHITLLICLFYLFIWGFTSLLTLYRSYHDR